MRSPDLPGLVPPSVECTQIHAPLASAFMPLVPLASWAAAAYSARHRIPEPCTAPRPCRSPPGRPACAGTPAAPPADDRWIKCLSGIDLCGCALPAKMICTGRFGSFRIRARRSGSLSSKGGALIGRKTARKSDGQRIRVQHFFGGIDRRLRSAARAAVALANGFRAYATSRSRRLSCVLHNSLAGNRFRALPQDFGRRAPPATSAPDTGRRAGSSQ